MTDPTAALRMLALSAPLGLLGLLGLTGPQDSPRIVLEGLDGSSRELPLAGLSLEDPRAEDAWIVRLASPVEGSRGKVEGRPVTVELVGGDVLRGRVAGGGGESLLLALAGGVELSVDILRMRRLQFAERDPSGRPILLEAPLEGDRLYQWTGRGVDPIGGAVESFTAEGVRFDSATLGAKLFPWKDIAALFVEVFDEGREDDREGVPIELDLVEEGRLSSRLKCSLVRLEEDGCRALVAGHEVLFPWAAIGEVVVDDGRLRYLSGIPAVGEEGRGAPFGDELGGVWDHAVDRCVTGGPLRAGGRSYRRGIGMHAPTRVRWELDGTFQALRAIVAIDDSALLNPADAHGSVVFRALLDGEPVWESGIVRGGDSPLELPAIALAGRRELALEADMVGDFQGDRANWLRVRLVR